MSAEIALPGEEIGDYVDSDNLARFAHIDTDGNFSENIGSRTIKKVTASSAPFATLPEISFVTKKLSNHVDLQIPDILGTSNTSGVSGIIFNNVIEAHDRPRVDKYFPVYILNNNIASAGFLRITASTGTLTFFLAGGTAWTNAAPAGVRAIDVGWDCKF